MTTDHDPVSAEFETLLRATLARRRPSAWAAAMLRSRVDEMVARSRGPSGSAPLRRALALPAAAAIVVVIVIAARLASAPTQMTPGATPPPTPSDIPFTTDLYGSGIVASADNLLSHLPGLVALAAVAAVLIALTRVRGRRLAMSAILIAALALSAIWSLSQLPRPSLGGLSGPELGLRVVEPTDLSGGQSVFHVTVPPEEPFMVVFNVKNDGALPLRLNGIVGGGALQRLQGSQEAVDDVNPSHLYWSAVWTVDPPEYGAPGQGATHPMRPFELKPGEYVPLYVVGRAPACALGPRGDPAGYHVVETVTLSYNVLGIPAAVPLDLPFVVAQPLRLDCPPT